jgi:hypothetical protein
LKLNYLKVKKWTFSDLIEFVALSLFRTEYMLDVANRLSCFAEKNPKKPFLDKISKKLKNCTKKKFFFNQTNQANQTLSAIRAQ